MRACLCEKGTLSPKHFMISLSNYGDAECDFYSPLFYFSNLYIYIHEQLIKYQISLELKNEKTINYCCLVPSEVNRIKNTTNSKKSSSDAKSS